MILKLTTAILLSSLLLLGGCASDFTNVAPAPTHEYQNLGPTKGSHCGSMGIIWTSTYFVPMGINSRVEKAYKEAVTKVPGATALINVTIKEDWYWWVIGTMRCVSVSGEAIK